MTTRQIRKLSIFILFFVLSLPAYSQILSLRLGGVIGKMDKSFFPSSKYFGFIGGVGGDFLILKVGYKPQVEWSFVHELLYVERPNLTAIYTQKFKYIESPLLTRLTIRANDYFGYVNFGTAIAFGLQYSRNSLTNGESLNLSFGEANLSPIDLAIQYGAGAGFKAGPGFFTLDFRKSVSFTNAYGSNQFQLDGNKDGTFNMNIYSKPGSYKSKYIAFTIGYAMSLRR